MTSSLIKSKSKYMHNMLSLLVNWGLELCHFQQYFSHIVDWWSVLLVEETRLPEETSDMSQVTDKRCIEYTSPWGMIDTDCTGSCKSNYHTNTATTASLIIWIRYTLFIKGYHLFNISRQLYVLYHIYLCSFTSR